MLSAVVTPLLAVLLSLVPGASSPGFDALDTLAAERAGRVLDVRAAPESAAPVFATVAGLDIHAPVQRPRLVGFHEAGGRGPLPLEPVRLEGPGEAGVSVVLPSRGRGTAPTSAVDIVVAADETVLAPVTGRVVAVSRYSLYGGTTDIVVVIAPDAAPGLLVKMLHVEGARVGVGDAVVGGRTPVAARGRLLPFASQVDRVVGERVPHVHIEVVRAG